MNIKEEINTKLNEENIKEEINGKLIEENMKEEKLLFEEDIIDLENEIDLFEDSIKNEEYLKKMNNIKETVIN
jgi:hypothetical protein